MKKSILITLLTLFVVTTAFAGCNAQTKESNEQAEPSLNITKETEQHFESEEVIVKSTPSPSPTPTPPPTADQLKQRFFETDVLNYIPENFYEKDEKTVSYDLITSDREKAVSLQDKYTQWLTDAAAKMGGEISVNIEGIPNWEMLNLLTFNYCEDKNNLKTALQSAINFDLTDGILNITPKNHVELFYELPETEKVKHINNSFMFAYLQTIYDDDLNFLDVTPPESYTVADFLFPIAPVKKYVFGDNWYDGRDKGKRRHTGTDINAPEGTPLLAVTDGTILDVGTNGGAGNYVVLLGADGTQYHYYHMVEPSNTTVGQEVTVGEQVGKVGDTGNSTANHLHFTLISPNGYYLNSYPYLKRAYDNLLNQG